MRGLPSVRGHGSKPRARVSLTGTGRAIGATGTGHIDRGWMDTPLGEFLNNRPWFRTQFGPYTVVTITFEGQYVHPAFPVVTIHRDGDTRSTRTAVITRHQGDESVQSELGRAQALRALDLGDTADAQRPTAVLQERRSPLTICAF